MRIVDQVPTSSREWDVVIQRAQRMDAPAFDAIVDAYAGRLCGFFRRLLGRNVDAEDLTQEVFLRVVRNIKSYDEQGRFEAWLFRIAANLARDHLRRDYRSPGWVSREEREADDDDRATDCSMQEPPDRSAERSEDVDRLQRAIARLPRPERQVVLLRHYGQLSFAEIAAYMDTPLGTALARAHRGLAKLREWMGPS